MLNKLKNFIRGFTPEFILLAYHYVLAQMAAFIYSYPAKKLYVVGITGTKGKTTTGNFVWSVLSSAGYKTGLIGTAIIRMGDMEKMNDYHMTMPGPFKLQRMIKQIVEAGCTHLVMEATSEGMKLYRHLGINYKVGIFTNLTPEHLPSHGGSFENYKAAKSKLFRALQDPNSLAIVNADSEHAEYYLGFARGKKLTYGIMKGEWVASNIVDSIGGVEFSVKDQRYKLGILGKFNVYNALPAIVLGNVLNIPYEKIKLGIMSLQLIPGRMEQIREGQDFTVIVDYAHEKISMNAVLDTARSMAGSHKVILLLGAEGGGRDKSKRAAMGEAAAKKADYVICSNVDPYEDDPTPIVEDIAKAAEQFGKIRNENLFVIEDRRAGIAKGLSLAKEGDIVVFTGKGAEQSMIIGGKSIPWDDRVVVREELRKLLNK